MWFMLALLGHCRSKELTDESHVRETLALHESIATDQRVFLRDLRTCGDHGCVNQRVALSCG
jgi:hypothetical protein